MIASITATPGPVSNANAPSATPRRGTQVTFAIPPTFSSQRPCCSCPNSMTSASGTSGAPCPPAATSRARKSLTTRTPTRSASTAASPSWNVARPGSCQIVWPWDAINDRSLGDTRACASKPRTAAANRSPSATCKNATSLGVPRAIASMMAPRSAALKGSCRNATSSAPPSAPSCSRTRAVDIPSSDVPDITPTASVSLIASRRADRRRRDGRSRRPPRAAGAPLRR